MKKIIKLTFLPFLFFTFIFSIYFSSAQGINSVLEYPQYFTTEALIKYGDLDMSHFQNDPHYFVWQDLFYKDGQTLGVRGYVFSFINIPIHLLSSYTKHFFNLSDFPKDGVSDVPNFAYELSIASFYSIFMVISLIVIWNLIKNITKKPCIAYLITFSLAFGTYMWKYAPILMRHGIEVAILSLVLNNLWTILSKNAPLKNLIVIVLLLSIAFGISPTVFVSLSFVFFLTLLYLISKKHKKIDFIKKLLAPTLIGVCGIGLNIIGNNYWYGSLYFYQWSKMPVFLNVVGDQWSKMQMATPTFPTIFYILFGYGKLPISIFSNYLKWPETLQLVISNKYAASYNFFGIFSTSLFLLPSLFVLFFPFSKNIKYFSIICLITFMSGILLTINKTDFWGGPTYDTRFFFSFIIALVIPLSLVVSHLMSRFSKKNQNIFIFLFVISVAYSVFSGWLGVMNMLKPAQSGEHRISIDLLNWKYVLPNTTLKEVLDATFMNRKNYLIPIIFSTIIYLIFLIKNFITSSLNHLNRSNNFNKHIF